MKRPRFLSLEIERRSLEGTAFTKKTELSFGIYIPVVLWADAVPMIGMLRIPKTCAYVWMVLIGYFDMRQECK